MPDLWVDVDTAIIVPVNIMPLLDDTDFKSIETAIVYNSAGMALTWNFVTSAGVVTGTAVTPTTAGVYDWSEPLADRGMYAIEIPASGGASINNDTEGFGWFTGFCTGVLPWRGPVIGFRRAALNDLLIEGSTASTNLEDFFDGTGYAGGTAKLQTDLQTIKTQAVTCAAGVTVLASVGTAATSTAQTGDSYAIINGASGCVAIKGDTAAILTDTAEIGVAGAGLTAVPWNATWDAEVESEVDDALGGGIGTALTSIPWNAAWDAEVQSEVDDALVTQRLDELLNADSDIDGVAPPTVGSVFHELLTKTAGSFTYDQTTDSLEAVRDNLGTAVGASLSADIAAIEAQTDDIGVAGVGLTAIPWNASWDAEVQSECNDALVAYDPPTKAEQDTAFTEIKGATWSAITDTLELIRDKETDIETDTAEIGAAGAGLTAVSLAAGGLFVKKNTALNNFMFLMVSDTDHVTPATGLTVTATRSIDGAAFGACANAVAELSDGIYKISLAAADTNGTVITFKFTAANADSRYITVITQA